MEGTSVTQADAMDDGSPSSTSNISDEDLEAVFKVKLLINKETKKVLFAEIGKDLVHYLFRLLDIPIVNLASALFSTVGADCPLQRLSSGLESLGATFDRGELHFRSNDCRAPCAWCKQEKAAPPPADDDLDGSPFSFLLMDDLTVVPCDFVAGAVMGLSDLGVRDLGALEERVTIFAQWEANKLMVHSLMSSTVLTDIYLKKENDVQPESKSEQKRSLENKVKPEPVRRSLRRRNN